MYDLWSDTVSDGVREKRLWGGGGNVKNMKGKIQTKVNDKGSQV